MRENATGKKKGSLSSALLLGLIFGIFLVICQELGYQHRLQKQYQEYTMETSAIWPTVLVSPSSEVTTMPSEEVITPVTPEITQEAHNEPTDAELEADPEESGTPTRYHYADGINDVTIDIGDEQIVMNFVAFESINSDFTGWFVIPGTDISYPVVQGEDNSFYLNHVFDGDYSTVGTLFADFRNTMLEDKNTIIYGHNFDNDGAMFSKLLHYAEQSFYDEHPVMYYLTEECGYEIEVLSVYEASIYDMIYNLSFPTDKDYQEFLDYVTEMSAVETGVSATVEDKIITLSTCSSTYSDGRFVVVGKVTAFE